MSSGNGSRLRSVEENSALELDMVRAAQVEIGKHIGAMGVRMERIEDILLSLANSGFIERLQEVEKRMIDLEAVPVQIQAIAADISTLLKKGT